MIKSMTGFGRCEYAAEARRFTVEMKAVNHRYLDVNIKMPKKLNFFESSIRSLLKEYMERGKVDIFISYEDILAQLEEGGVSDRKIYVESEYIYYLLSAKISPYEYNIWVTGTEQYQNVVFHLPEEIEPDAVYIVRDTNAEYIGRLQNMYKEQCSDGMFVCYY